MVETEVFRNQEAFDRMAKKQLYADSPLCGVFGNGHSVQMCVFFMAHQGMDYTQKEIAENLGIARQSVKVPLESLLSCGIAKISRKIGKTVLYGFADSECAVAIQKFNDTIVGQIVKEELVLQESKSKVQLAREWLQGALETLPITSPPIALAYLNKKFGSSPAWSAVMDLIKANPERYERIRCGKHICIRKQSTQHTVLPGNCVILKTVFCKECTSYMTDGVNCTNPKCGKKLQFIEFVNPNEKVEENMLREVRIVSPPNSSTTGK